MKTYYVDDEKFLWRGRDCRILPEVESGTIRFVVERSGEEFTLTNSEFEILSESDEVQSIPKRVYRADDQPNPVYDRLSEKAKLYAYVRHVKVECIKAIKRLGPGAGRKEKMEAGNDIIRREYQKDPVKFHSGFGRSIEKSFRTFKRWLRSFDDSGGDPASQMPKHYRKGNRAHKYADAIDIEPYIEAAINAVQKDTKRWTIQAVLDEVVGDIHKDNEQLLPSLRINPPSYDVVYRHVNALTEYESVLFEEGPEAPRVRFRRSLQRNRDRRALTFVEVDHTVVDVLLVDDEGEVVGRPTLTALICRNTKVLLGYYLGYEPPSFRTVSMALKMALKKKTKPLRAKNEWPMCGVPFFLVVDNGLEFHSHHLEALEQALGFVIKYCPRKTAWYKGTVERWFGTANTRLFHRLPGTTLSRTLDLGDYSPEKNACLTLEQLREIFEAWVCDDYHQSRHRAINTSPAHLWAERQEIEACRQIPPERVDVEIGETATKQLTREGLSGPPGLKLQYASDALSALYEEVGSRMIEFRYNSLDLGRIYAFHPSTDELIPADCTYGDYAVGLSEFMHRRITKRLKERSVAATQEALSEAKRAISGLVDDAKSGLKKKRRARAQEQSRAQAQKQESQINDNSNYSAPGEPVPFFGTDLALPEIEVMKNSGGIRKV